MTRLGGICLVWAAMAAPAAAQSSLPASSTPFNWTGPYVGARAGYGIGSSRVRLTPTGAFFGDPDEAFNAANGSRTLSGGGFTGGGHGGFNLQVGPGTGLVVGLEGTASFLDFTRSYATGFISNTTHAPPNTAAFSARVDADAIFSVRARLGVGLDWLLLYGLRGLAITPARFSQSVLYPTFVPPAPAAGAPVAAAPAGAAPAEVAGTPVAPVPPAGLPPFAAGTLTLAGSLPGTVVGVPAQPLSGFNSGARSATLVGFTVGAGGEYALADNWAVRLEYSYSDFGRIRFSTANPDFPAFTTRHRADFVVNSVNAGLSYRFTTE